MHRDRVTDEGGPQLQVENATGVKKVFERGRGRTCVVLFTCASQVESNLGKKEGGGGGRNRFDSSMFQLKVTVSNVQRLVFWPTSYSSTLDTAYKVPFPQGGWGQLNRLTTVPSGR